MCYNPMIMRCVQANNMQELIRLKELGYKVNTHELKAYRLMSQESRNLPLEHIGTYVSQDDIEVGCGGCIQCRLDKARDWANRCTLEASQHQHNYFVTFTYDDDHLPLGRIGNPTLVPDDMTKFFKRLRKKFGQGIKYLYCGEYGDQTYRPHYHAIIFNCNIPDLTIDFVDKDGNRSRHKNGLGTNMYYSQIIRDLWSLGNIMIDDANYNTESYVSRYIMKKQTGQNSSIYTQDLGIVPPFIRMSLKPAIGADYLNLHINSLKDDPHIYVGRQGKKPIVSGLPRYFKKKLFLDDPFFKDMAVEKAKDSTNKARSLLKGKQLINENRSVKETKFITKSNSFIRDF